jgi:hypothetical protein
MTTRLLLASLLSALSCAPATTPANLNDTPDPPDPPKNRVTVNTLRATDIDTLASAIPTIHGPPGLEIEGPAFVPFRIGRKTTFTLRLRRLGGYTGPVSAVAVGVPPSLRVLGVTAAGGDAAELHMSIEALSKDAPSISRIQIEVSGESADVAPKAAATVRTTMAKGPSTFVSHTVDLVTIPGPVTFDEAQRERSTALLPLRMDHLVGERAERVAANGAR